eukprot:gene1563-3019_t
MSSNEGAPDQQLREIILQALVKFGKEDLIGSILEYLQSEWYSSIDDLLVAIDDGQAWSDLKLPSRLKLEVKFNLGADNSRRTNNNRSLNRSTFWLRCFSHLDNCAYFYNTETECTQWEEPNGPGDEIIDDLSYRHRHSSMTTNDNIRGSQTHSSQDDDSDNMPNDALPSHPRSPSADHTQQLWAQNFSLLSAGINNGVRSASSLNQTESLPVQNALQPMMIAVINAETDNGSRVNILTSTSINMASENEEPLPIAIAVSGIELHDINISSNSSIELIAQGSDDLHFTDADSDSNLNSDMDTPPPPVYSPLNLVQRLQEMGFSEEDCIRALEHCGNSLPEAAAYLLSTNTLLGN